jgi:hypothetical protein
MNLVLTKKIGAYFGVIALSMSTAFSAHSAALYSGQITGTWSTAVTSGNAKEGENPGIVYPTNNSTSAYCNLSNCPNKLTVPSGSGATLIWGDSDDATPPSSTVTFKGSSFSNVKTELRDAQGKITQASDIFQLGTLTYTNGTSGLDTLIFGSTLTLAGSLIGTTEKIDPFVIQLGIDTTLNSGTPEQNADFLFFANQLGTTAPVSFNVYEGQTATAIVWGRLVGDPILLATGLTLAPGSAGAGFIANGAITSANVPAPNAIALILVGFLALSFGRFKKA